MAMIRSRGGSRMRPGALPEPDSSPTSGGGTGSASGRPRPTRRRRIARVAISLGLSGLVMIGIAQPSYANSGNLSGSNSQGNGRVAFSTGSYLFVDGNVTDKSCNSKGIAVKFKVRADDGTLLQERLVWDTQGCNTGAGQNYVFNASQLSGRRSGYIELYLCWGNQTFANCSGVLDSGYWNF